VNPPVLVEVLEECYAEGDCSSHWFLTDGDYLGELDLFVALTEQGPAANHWRFLCRRHKVEVRLKHGQPVECAGRARLQPGRHEVSAALAESLVSKRLARRVQTTEQTQSPSTSPVNASLKRAGLPEITAEDQDFMRRVVTAKSSATAASRPSSSPIDGISKDDLGEIQGILKGLRDRK
jgi:hypothetical protein